MKKSEFVKKVAEKSGSTVTEANVAVNAFVESLIEVLVEGESISFIGLGSFKTKEKAERTARNPITGETIVVPAGKVAAFKASPTLKQSLK